MPEKKKPDVEKVTTAGNQSIWKRISQPMKKRKARSGQRHQTSQLKKLDKEGY
jgi:hypothetical protein